MSNRLTFSLASLILIFALVFVAMPVMAATGGPTVMIADGGTEAAPTTRDSVKVKFTFNVRVTDFDDLGDAVYAYYGADNAQIGGSMSVPAPAPVAGDQTGTMYMATIDTTGGSGIPMGAVGFIVSVPADKAMGGELGHATQDKGNVTASQRLALEPAVMDRTVEITKMKADPQDSTTDGVDWMVTFAFKDKADTPKAAVPAPLPTAADHVIIEPAYLKTLVVGTETIGEKVETPTDIVGTYELSIVQPTGAPDFTLTLSSGYIAGAEPVEFMMAATDDDEVDPVVMADDVSDTQSAAFYLMFTVDEDNLPSDAPYGITVMGDPDAATGKYTIGDVTMGDDAAATNDYKVMITPTANVDMAETAVTFTITAEDESENTGSDTATATLAARTMDTTGLPAAAIAVSNHNRTLGTFDIEVTFTPAESGSAVTGFDATKLKVVAANMAPVAVTEYTGTPENPVDPGLMGPNSYRATLKYNPRHTLPLTVTIDQSMEKTSNEDHSATVGPGTTTTVVKAKATFSGMLYLDKQSVITVTLDKAETKLTKADFKVTGGTINNLRVKPRLSTAMANKVWQVAIDPDDDPFTESIMVTIAATSKLAVPAATMGSLTTAVPEGTLNSITAPAGANDTAVFTVTLTFGAALPSGIDVVAADLKLTPTTAKVTGIASLDRIAWQVQIKPTKGMNTKIELSEKGKLKFAYAGAALTVMKKDDTTAGGTVTAAYVAPSGTTPGTTTISVGAIAGNGFAVIDHMGLPDLQLFFDIGGTITLHDADATKNDGNVRSVVMSEILWGLDTGESPVGDDQEKHQFIELYNTTADSINLKGWTLVFTPGNVRPPIDIDQVSNRGPDGWLLANGPGKSGRIAGTTADPTTDSLLAPSRIISMYRKIDYDKVEKVKDDKPDPNRDEQLKGIPGGNAVGSWANSVRPSQHRWILSTKGEQHHKTIGLLEASKVAGKPFVISEFGNDTGGDNDWIELHNLDTTARSLENVQVSMVTAKGTDTELFDFVGNKDNPDTVDDKEWTVPPGGYIVISTRHPRDTDLATGKDISTPDSEQVNKGLKHLYAVKPGWNLQDDGKFALILRNTHDKLGTGGNGNLVDVVATRSGAFADTNTSLWPLVLGGNPHGNVIDGGDENFGAGKVYQRNDVKNNGRGDKSLAVASYTGIGYDVKASKITANHGTPGYAKDAAQATKAGIGADVVTISEIMYDVGDAALRRKLPQWIELHNASLTLGVNLKGWKLHLENAAQANGDLETNTFSATVTIGDKFILPNQTIIVASSTGNVRDPNHFPATRVINLWTNKTHRDALEMTHPTDPVLSTRGFSITLVDKDGEEIDMVGNLDGNRRTRDEPAWALPAYDADDRSRSSILRVYAQKVALDGKMADSWKLASDTVLAFEVSHAYYGSSDDIGSPGYRLGDPLPVSLSKFRPERQDDGTIAIRWITESELNNAGFNILRSETRNGEFKQINTKLIAGHGTTSERSTYTYTDPSAKPNVVYYYQIQDVSLDGKVTTLRQTRLKGHISAAGKLTTTWGELKALQ